MFLVALVFEAFDHPLSDRGEESGLRGPLLELVTRPCEYQGYDHGTHPSIVTRSDPTGILWRRSG
jgi:hypothetical protein